MLAGGARFSCQTCQDNYYQKYLTNAVPRYSVYSLYLPKTTKFMGMRMKNAINHRMPYEIQHHFVPLSEVPTFTVRAILIAEDINFPTHHGVDLRTMYEGLLKNIKMNSKI